MSSARSLRKSIALREPDWPGWATAELAGRGSRSGRKRKVRDAVLLVAHVGRPSTTAEDRFFDFAPAADGSFVTAEPLAPGLWEVDLRAERGQEILFRRSQEVFIRPAEPQS